MDRVAADIGEFIAVENHLSFAVVPPGRTGQAQLDTHSAHISNGVVGELDA